MKSPILFIVPKKRDKYRTEGIANIEGGGEREAYIIGMGDISCPHSSWYPQTSFSIPQK